jgi:hypothetical protein
MFYRTAPHMPNVRCVEGLTDGIRVSSQVFHTGLVRLRTLHIFNTARRERCLGQYAGG